MAWDIDAARGGRRAGLMGCVEGKVPSGRPVPERGRVNLKDRREGRSRRETARLAGQDEGFFAD